MTTPDSLVLAAITRACDADKTRPYPLYDNPYAPTFYPSAYFIRRLAMLRLGADGIPEVAA